MFGRKPETIGGRISERPPGKLDRVVGGALLLGMANWLTTSLFNFDTVQAVAGRRSVSGRTLYGIIGLSGVYATVRGARKAA